MTKAMDRIPCPPTPARMMSCLRFVGHGASPISCSSCGPLRGTRGRPRSPTGPGCAISSVMMRTFVLVELGQGRDHPEVLLRHAEALDDPEEPVARGEGRLAAGHGHGAVVEDDRRPCSRRTAAALRRAVMPEWPKVESPMTATAGMDAGLGRALGHADARAHADAGVDRRCRAGTSRACSSRCR